MGSSKGDNIDLLEELLREMPGITTLHKYESFLSLEGDEMMTTTAINKYCFEKGIVLSHLNLKRKSLEKRFLEITGGKSDR